MKITSSFIIVFILFEKDLYVNIVKSLVKVKNMLIINYQIIHFTTAL